MDTTLYLCGYYSVFRWILLCIQVNTTLYLCVYFLAISWILDSQKLFVSPVMAGLSIIDNIVEYHNKNLNIFNTGTTPFIENFHK